MFDLFFHSSRVPQKVSVCELFGKFHFVRATPSTGNNKDTIRCPLVLTKHRSKHDSSAMEGELPTSKCQASSLFDDDSPEEAKQDNSFMLRNQLHFYNFECE
jgi:hypothetical protein